MWTLRRQSNSGNRENSNRGSNDVVPTARKRNPTQRIGGKVVGGDIPEEETLAKHRKTREKTVDNRERIKVAMKQDQLCALVEDPSLDAIVETMEYYEFKRDEVIVTQGTVGSTFYVLENGKLEVSVDKAFVNILNRGTAFGGLALLYHCPRTATVKAATDCGVWGANGSTFRSVIQSSAQRHYAENRKFLDSVKPFEGLTPIQKDHVGSAIVPEVFEADSRVVTQGDPRSAVYFVKRGKLRVCKGGSIKANGEFVNGIILSYLGPGDCFGEDTLLQNEKHEATIITCEKCELLSVSIAELRNALGNDLAACLERNAILVALTRSPVISQFTGSQQSEIAKVMTVKLCNKGQGIGQDVLFTVVLEGEVTGQRKGQPLVLERGQFLEDCSIVEDMDDSPGRKRSKSLVAVDKGAATAESVVAGPAGARVAILTSPGLATALKNLGWSDISSGEDASDCTRRLAVTKKVHIFRHLSQEQTNKLIKSFQLQKYKKGDRVIEQGTTGSCFFVIASGEVAVQINGKTVRSLGKHGYFGERALLFDEPRTATINISSETAELWSIDKTTFFDIVQGKMHQELMKRIALQDTSVALKDVQHIRVIGIGAAGVVRLVQHKKTNTRYALKRVHKDQGKIPEEVKRECSLLSESDHPFIMKMVKTFETKKSVYILSELIIGGDLFSAIRQIPTVLSRSQAQFYAGSLLIILEELSDRNIVYRDLKPENVMLDHQGYLKLIDFGIAKKLEEENCRTFTLVGTPHYMAPEVMRGNGYGIEVDLWSVGVILFEFVCGYLPFADDLDDPTGICRAVLKDPLGFPRRYQDKPGQMLIQGLLCRQPKNRLGHGKQGFEKVKNEEFFKAGHSGASIFDKIMGRELDPPVIPQGETYMDTEETDIALSDMDELG